MSATPETLSRCHDLGVCVMDAHCHHRFECASEVREMPRDLPQPLASLGDEPLLSLEGCERLLFCCLVVAVVVLSAGVLGLAAVAYRQDIADALSAAWGVLEQLAWAGMSRSY